MHWHFWMNWHDKLHHSIMKLYAHFFFRNSVLLLRGLITNFHVLQQSSLICKSVYQCGIIRKQINAWVLWERWQVIYKNKKNHWNQKWSLRYSSKNATTIWSRTSAWNILFSVFWNRWLLGYLIFPWNGAWSSFWEIICNRQYTGNFFANRVSNSFCQRRNCIYASLAFLEAILIWK